jgi:hypothetical protein
MCEEARAGELLPGPWFDPRIHGIGVQLPGGLCSVAWVLGIHPGRWIPGH